MSVRLAPTLPDTPRLTAKVAKVAADYFDADVSQVYRLIAEGELEAHTFGKRGVRVFLDSVATYQENRTKRPKRRVKPLAAGTPYRRSRASQAAHEAAMVALKAHGLLQRGKR